MRETASSYMVDRGNNIALIRKIVEYSVGTCPLLDISLPKDRQNDPFCVAHMPATFVVPLRGWSAY